MSRWGDQNPIVRFMEKVIDGADDCWEWIGAKGPSGYSHFNDGGRYVYGHRWAYEHWIGPIPEGMEIDHACHNRACVNPIHLRPVTHKENQSWLRVTQCHRGHLFDIANTRYSTEGYKHCRACDAYRARIKRRNIRNSI